MSDCSSDVCASDLIERLKEIVEFSDGSPILVARTWQHSRDRLRDEFPGIRSLKTKRDLDAWNAGDIEIAEPHPASIGHGDRKSVVEGKSVSVRLDVGGRRIIKKKKNTKVLK